MTGEAGTGTGRRTDAGGAGTSTDGRPLPTAARKGAPARGLVPDARAAARPGTGTRKAPPTGEYGPLSPVDEHEPLSAARVRRPGDVVRCVAGLLGIAAVLLMAGFARNTTAGLGSDLPVRVHEAPGSLASAVGFVSGAGVLLVPLAFAVDRLVRRDGGRLADGVLAAVLAYGFSLGLDGWVAQGAGEGVRTALTRATQTGEVTDAVHVYLAPVIACMTAAGMAGRPRSRVALWAGVVLCGTTALLSGYATVLSLTLTVLLGWAAGHGTLYAVGAPGTRPTARHLLTGLRKVGFTPTEVRRTPDAALGAGRYYVVHEEGPPLDVRVIDSEQQASGFFYRLWRRLRLRSFAVRRTPQSVHQALEQEALIAYAAASSRARTPRLLAATELGADAALLAYEHIPGRALDELADDEISDALLLDWWRSVKALHDRRISHGRLCGSSLLAVDGEQGYLVELSEGSIAAGDLLLRMDVAHLLTVLALRVGPDRAVDSATEVLGSAGVGAALPLLQPIGLVRTTRLSLRRYDKDHRARARALAVAQVASGEKTQAEADRALAEPDPDLLARIRAKVLEETERAEATPVRLERLKPKTLASVVAGAFAVYLLCSQLTVRPSQVIARAEAGWALAAFGAAALSYVAAAMSLTGFVPERLRFGRAVLAQLAGSFVKLVAPAAVGGVALNTRYLQRAGLRPVQAAASVGASQLVGLGCHIVLLAVFGYLAGNEQTTELTPSRTVVAGLLTAAVLLLAVMSVAPVRRWLLSRLRPLLVGVVPRMLDLVQRPGKLATGFGGTILLTVFFVACLDLSVRAFGGHISFSVAAVVFLAGNAIGSAAPIPGGVGSIEVALATGLRAAAGLDYSTAYLAVLLFRLLTFWLPVLPGWLAFAYLQRKKAL
ncbi:lysylphosphatidylglycerol synthase transmembrane domain-containing protein [Streptomyces tsukubensis]|uniref:lysylphosphatidylglycerol synthase transmembrane domain-containing protein n=1 Tax=Streptomyces tsukubensis TaxID=83656 RepID=UPI001D03D36F|nr:lysylphosphatidylglycerol synthase transmembrane domain-containing protein [Streptomyces tsukubensis]